MVEHRIGYQVYYQDLKVGLNVDQRLADLYDFLKSPEFAITGADVEIDQFDDDLLRAEIFQYLEWSVDKVGFRFRPGEKTNQLVARYAKKFTYGQICSLIYSSINFSLRQKVENKLSGVHGFNLLISALEKTYLKAVSENWSVREAFRNKETPVSALRYVRGRVKVKSVNSTF